MDEIFATPLHFACKKGHLEIAKKLLEKGANPSNQKNDERTPLHDAAENGFTQLVALLLDFGADPFIANSIPLSARSPFCDCEGYC
jgi:ankyrin repeat protein